MNAKSFIFGFIAGGALSGVSVYFIMKKKNEKKIDEARKECEDLIVQMKEHYIEEFSPKKAAVVKEEPEEIVKRYHTEASRYVREDPVQAIDPAELERPADDAPEEYYEGDPNEAKHFAEGLAADRYDKAMRDKPPAIIPKEEYGQAPGFEGTFAIYYVDDKTFCGDDDVVISVDDEVRFFGTCLDDWKNNDDMTNDIYIRNYQYNCDYEIEKRFCKCPQFINAE